MNRQDGRPLRRLKRRSQFLRAARGRKQVRQAFVVQAIARPPEEDDADVGVRPVGIGFTASRRVGGAVQRNRARRRLREAAIRVLPSHGLPGCDYVLVARPPVLTWPFDRLLSELEQAVSRLVPAGMTQDAAPSPERG